MVWKPLGTGGTLHGKANRAPGRTVHDTQTLSPAGSLPERSVGAGQRQRVAMTNPAMIAPSPTARFQ